MVIHAASHFNYATANAFSRGFISAELTWLRYRIIVAQALSTKVPAFRQVIFRLLIYNYAYLVTWEITDE